MKFLWFFWCFFGGSFGIFSPILWGLIPTPSPMAALCPLSCSWAECHSEETSELPIAYDEKLLEPYELDCDLLSWDGEIQERYWENVKDSLFGCHLDHNECSKGSVISDLLRADILPQEEFESLPSSNKPPDCELQLHVVGLSLHEWTLYCEVYVLVRGWYK